MIFFTSRAKHWLRLLRQSMGREGSGLRIAITGGSRCGGYEYFVGFEDEPAKEDIRLEVDDFVLYLDPASHEQLQGAKVDFVDSPEGSGFVVTPGGKRAEPAPCCCARPAASQANSKVAPPDGCCPARKEGRA